jgi:hypothetical protein
MSDLSNLLGDVYGDHSSPDAAPVRHEPAAYDRMPMAPAPAPAPMPMVDLSAVEAPAPAWVEPAPAPAPSFSVSAPVPAMAGGSLWANGDDDIFPVAKGAKKKK